MHRQELLTPKEAAKWLGVTKKTVLNWIRKGTLPALRDRVNGRLYIRKDHAEEFTLEKRLEEVSNR